MIIPTIVTGQIIVNTIKKSAEMISESLRFIIQGIDNHPKVSYELKALDLDTKMVIIQKFIKHVDSDSARLIHQSIDDLQISLLNFQIQHDKHRNKYFSSYRKFEYQKYLDDILINNAILDNRIKLIKNMTIIKHSD